MAELEAARIGRVRAHHCYLLAQPLVHRDSLRVDEQIELFTRAIAQRLASEQPEPPAAHAAPFRDPPADPSELTPPLTAA